MKKIAVEAHDVKQLTFMKLFYSRLCMRILFIMTYTSHMYTKDCVSNQRQTLILESICLHLIDILYTISFSTILHDECCTISFFQHQDLNARLTMNAPPTLHVSVKNVKIRAKVIPVASTPNVWLETTELSVFALMDLSVTHSPFVKNVRCIHTTNLVLSRFHIFGQFS